MLSVEFLSELDTRLLHHPPAWANPDRAFQLLSPFRVRIGQFEVVEIPVGFISDFASIPSFMRPFISPTHAKISRPAWLHDFAYATNYRDSRRISDDLIMCGMMVEGASRVLREMVYTGVRLGGWVAWDRYRRRSGLELQKSLGGLRPATLNITVAGWNRNLDGLS